MHSQQKRSRIPRSHRLVLELFHVGIGQHRAETAHCHLQEHVQHPSDWDATTSTITFASQHVDAHGEHYLSRPKVTLKKVR